ncbi:MAG: tetratricopeptide repeat protein [Acidobacteria bacterium]|nr:tetratricopeptide repeat protein [Acidobacteriota bacterium]
MNRYEPHKLTVRVVLVLLLLCHAVAWDAASAQRKAGRRGQAAVGAGRTTTSKGDRPASQQLEEAQRYADEGNWAEAIKAYRQAVAANPKDGDAYVGMGDAYMSAGKYEEAFAAYRDAIRVAPWNADAHYSLGAAYNDMAQYGDAFKPFVQAIRLDSNYAEAYYGIGYAYQNLENYKEAVGYLRSAIRLRPDHAEAQLSLGRSYLGLGNVKGAEEQLRILEGSNSTLAKDLDREIGKASGAARAAREQSTAAERIVPEATPRRESTPVEKGRRAASAAAGTSPEPAARTERPATKPAANPVPSPANNSASLIAVELSFWESIKNSGDPEEFAAYIRKYPDGQFVELARIRLRALEGKRVETASADAEIKQPEREAEVAAAQPQPTPQLTPEPTPQPAPPPTPEPTPEPTPTPAERRPVEPVEPGSAATLEETLSWLRKNFSASFKYKYTTAGETADDPSTTEESEIDYEPLRFEGCAFEWRDGKDTLSVALSELDPLGVKVEPRGRPHTTFSVEVWNVRLAAAGGKLAFRETRGDGSGEVNTYSGVNLQFYDKAKAERMARVLQHAVKLCAGRAAP